ncbi:MAG: hypothetical protein ACR2PS_12830 [Pseudomonadales bacterium]
MPAAGHARRLGEIEHSKELLSIKSPADEQPVCANLLRQFRQADAGRACIVSRHAKVDIPASLGSGEQYGLALQYSFVEHSPSVPHTINAAYGEIKNKEVLFGFPDILIKPANALQTLAAKRSAANSDVMLGLFPSTQPEKVDMVDYDSHGRLRAIVIKDPACTLRETWLLAVWNARFTDWLQHWVEDRNTDSAEEPQLGRAFCAAITQGLQVDTYLFPNGEYLDIGTPDDLAVAQQKIWGL